jgi:hypothetical protein
MQQGVSSEEAQRLARLRFGSLAASRDVHRDSRSLPSVEEFLFDVRLSLRGLRRDWGFTLAAVAMLALAIGLNVTVFAVMDTMLFRGYPLVKRNDRLHMHSIAWSSSAPSMRSRCPTAPLRH